MLALDLSSEVEDLLEQFAAKAGMSKAALARKAILSYLEDLEDAMLAQEALDEGGKTIPLAEVMREYGLEEKI